MSTHQFTIKFVGMDVGKRSISLTTLTHQDELAQRKLPYNSQNILTFIGKRCPGKQIVFVYESGPTGYGLYDEITAAGHTCLVVPGANCSAAP